MAKDGGNRSRPLQTSPNRLIQAASPQPKRFKLDTAPRERLSWVDKYKPATLKQVIGQRDSINKLVGWFRQRSNKAGGSKFKAVLLSGPPGIGKTLIAQLVCQELKLAYAEFNASDTRLSNLFEISRTTKENQQQRPSAIIFDEVDGIVTGDRGSVHAEIIAIIKNTEVPVICICNNRYHPKIRSLVNHCLNINFYRPRAKEISSIMRRILQNERVRMSWEYLDEIITAANQDVRQILHTLFFLKYSPPHQNCCCYAKDMTLNPFEIFKKLFGLENGGGGDQNLTINDKLDLASRDRESLFHLFVHENYTSVNPAAAAEKNALNLLSKTADCISYADIINGTTSRENDWSLSPVETMFADVIPASYLSGRLTETINFPKWLGHNSSKTQMERSLEQIYLHFKSPSRIRGGVFAANRTDLSLDYLPYFKTYFAQHLARNPKEGVPTVVDFLLADNLSAEGLNCVLKLCSWSSDSKSLAILPKTKASLTRTLNKKSRGNAVLGKTEPDSVADVIFGGGGVPSTQRGKSRGKGRGKK